MNAPVKVRKRVRTSPFLKRIWVRWSILTGLGLVLLLGFAASALHFLDMEDFRQAITTSLSRTTASKVDLKSLEFDFSEGIGLTARGFSVHSADGKRRIFSADRLFLQAGLLPLVTGQFKVKKAAVTHPVITLYLDDNKNTAGTATDNDASPGDKPLIDIVRDVLEQYSLSVKQIRFRDGIVHLIRQQRAQKLEDEVIRFGFNLKIKRSASGKVDGTLDQLKVSIGDIRFLGVFEVRDLLSSNGTLQGDIRSRPFSASQLKHLAYFLPNTFSRHIMNLPFSGEFQPITLRATVPLDAFRNADSLHHALTAASHLEARNIALRAGEVTVPISRLNSQAKFARGKIRHTLTLSLLRGEILLDGVLKFPPPETPSGLPSVNSVLQIKPLDFSGIQTPPGTPPARGRLKGRLTLSGNLKSADYLTLNGMLEGQGLQWTTTRGRHGADTVQTKIHTRPGAPPTMDLELANLWIQGIPFKRYTGRLTFPEKRMKFDKSILYSRRGKIGWKGVYHTKNRRYDLQVAGRKLRLEDFKQGSMSGTLRFTGMLNGRVPENAPPARGLSGKLSVRITRGSFRKMSGAKAVFTILNPTSLGSLGKKGLTFDRLSGDIVLDEGLMTSHNIAFESSQLKIYLDGLLDLPTGDLNMNGKALPSPDLDRALQSIPLVGTLLAGSTKQDGLIETFFKVRGTLKDPDITVQAGKSILEKPKRMLKQIGRLGTG